jgi:hypothetical protein
MTTFPGFGISGYRSLFGEAQWMPLDEHVTVFLGGNNSGKSNVLRLLDSHMGAIFRSLADGKELQTFNPRFDAPRDRGDTGLEVHWPLDTDAIAAAPQLQSARHDVETILALPELNRFGIASLPFKSETQSGALEITLEFCAGDPGVLWGRGQLESHFEQPYGVSRRQRR